jgi:hypothetical protein
MIWFAVPGVANKALDRLSDCTLRDGNAFANRVLAVNCQATFMKSLRDKLQPDPKRQNVRLMLGLVPELVLPPPKEDSAGALPPAS